MGELTVAGLLDQAEIAGLSVRSEGDRLVVEGPRVRAGLANLVLTHKASVLEVLAGHAAPGPDRCARCGADRCRLVVPYWSDEVAFCPPCCEVVVEMLDLSGGWPQIDWDLTDVEGLA